MMPAARLPRSPLGALLALALLATPAARASSWVPLGPPAGGTVLSLAYDPTDPAVVYAGLDGGGVAKSVDGGLTWEPSGAGLDGASIVTALAVDPLLQRRVYACTPRGLFLSTDGGATWRGTLHRWARSVVADPVSAGRVWVGTENGLFRSFDGGRRWTEVAREVAPRFEPRRFSIRAVAFEPSDPRTLYAAYVGGLSQLYRSTDGGRTWTGIFRGGFHALAVDPARPRTLYASGCYRRGRVNQCGTFVSRDGGASWPRVLLRTFAGFAADPGGTGAAYAFDLDGIQVSTDGGAHWTAIDAGLPDRAVLAVAVDPEDPDRLLAGLRNGGVYRSADGGAHWMASGTGLVNGAALAVAVAPGGSPLYAGTSSGVYRTADGGATWANVLAIHGVRDVALHPDAPDTVWAVAGGLWGSTDGGATWSFLGLAEHLLQRVWIAPADPGIVFIAGEGRDTALVRSDDGGATWDVLPGIHGVRGLAIDPHDPDRLFATREEDLMRSDDGGLTWRLALLGDVPTIAARQLRDVALAPSDTSVVIAADLRFVLGSDDGGRTWRRLRGPLDALDTVAIDPLDAATVYAGGAGGVLRTRDGGATWQRFHDGLFGFPVLDFAFDPADPDHLYAGTAAAGVFRIDLAD
jgi:photosystem II stability/assembly factor-like uncharacterized protein